MSDVKDINKYYPPDFDPEAFHRHKHVLKQGKGRRRVERIRKTTAPGGGGGQSGGKKMELRMLWPFSIVCDGCESVLFVGTKFNSKVEKVRGENYLGVAIWRIAGRCADCRQDIVLKTDPKNTDYIIERGGHRLFDAALAKREVETAKQEYVDQQAQLNQMEKLEMKALNTAQEVEDLEVLENLKKMNKILLTSDLNNELLIIVNEKDDEEMSHELRDFRRLKEEFLFSGPPAGGKAEAHRNTASVPFNTANTRDLSAAQKPRVRLVTHHDSTTSLPKPVVETGQETTKLCGGYDSSDSDG